MGVFNETRSSFNSNRVRGIKCHGTTCTSVQFAAIAEIVTLLRDDPATNWAQVDIKALRDHLVDMDNVTTKASVQQTMDGLSVVFSITGGDVVASSIQRMVLAHSPMLQRSSGWTVFSEEMEDGAAMMV